VPELQVSVPIGHELLGQCIKQGQALVQRASLVGDFSDYESWKAARKQWLDATVQALEHMYGGPREAREFADAVRCPEGSKRWQEQYTADLKCVEAAIDLLTVLQGELAFTGAEPAPAAPELTAGAREQAISGRAAVGVEPERAAAGEETEGAAASDDAERSAAGADPGAGGEREGKVVAADFEPEAAQPQAPTQPHAPAQAPAMSEPPAPAPIAEPPRESEIPIERPWAEPPADVHASEPAVGAELTPAAHVGSQLAHQANGTAPAERDPAGASAQAPSRARQVLLAHGRDERWKQAVEHLLEQTGEHEIRIVNQRAGDRGRLADALGEQAPASRYAVVLLTADDVGGPRLESEREPFFSTRAHQEVVFQMGFLVAALSPGRVCVLYEDGVELPYDLEGVSHVRLDLAGTWQPKLLLHLRRAGFDYDVNRLVEV
jgi:predicted nucleotide-binding protein